MSEDTSKTSTALEPVAYTVLEKSLVGNKIYEAGETAMYDGLPAENLAPTCDVGKARYQEYLRTNAERVAVMKEMHGGEAAGDAAAFGRQFLELLAAQNATHAEQMAALQAAQSELISQAVAGALANAFPNGVQAPAAWTPKPSKGKAAKDVAATAATDGSDIA